ncbi:MAG: hypothetical protein AAF367_10065 [Pseudomonadota bacterium]
MTTAQLKQGSLRLLLSIPVLGWMIRDMLQGRDSAIGFFAVNYALIVLVTTLVWGLPMLVLGATGGAFAMMIILIMITRS